MNDDNIISFPSDILIMLQASEKPVEVCSVVEAKSLEAARLRDEAGKLIL